MRAVFEIRNPDAVEASVTVTMTIKQWRELRGQMGNAWPSWDFARVIGDVIRKAEQQFYAIAPDEDEQP